MKPRPRPRCRAAFGPAVLAAVAVFAFVLAVPGSVLGQSPDGGKGGLPTGDGPPDGLSATASAGNGITEGAPRASLVPPRAGFYSNLGLLDSISREAVNAIADSLTLPPGSAVTLYASTPHEANWFVGNILGEVLAGRGYQVRILDWGPAPAATGSSTTVPVTPPTTPNPASPAPADPKDAEGDSSPPPAADAGENEKTPADSTAPAADSTQAQAGAASGQTLSDGSPAVDPSNGPAGSTEAPAPGPAAGSSPRALPTGQVLDLRVVEFGVSYADVGRRLLFGPVRFTRVAGVYVQLSSRTEPEGELRQILSAERHVVDRLSGSQRSLAEGASYPFNIPQLKTPGLGRYIEPTVVVGIVGSLVYLFYANQSSK